MKKILLLSVLGCAITISNVNAQGLNQRLTDRDGKPILTKDYTDVSGSPYLTADWSNGTVKLAGGQTAADVPVKYNLMDDVLTFKDKDGNEMAFAEPVDEFTITYKSDDQTVTKHYRKGYKDISRTTPDSYFEVLNEGAVQLIKKTTVGIVISQEWNSASKTKNFKDVSKYYLVIDGKATPVKNDKKAIIALLPAKQQQLQDYVKTNQIEKSDADLGKLVTYYNSL